MKNALHDVYPAFIKFDSCTLLSDNDLIELVRSRLGDDVALVLEHRLEIAKPPVPDWEDRLEDLSHYLERCCDILSDLIDE